MKKRSVGLGLELVASFSIAILILAICIVPSSLGAGYPEAPITMVVPYGPGGVDRDIRAMAPTLGKILGQPLVIENRAGAGSSIGTYYVVQAKPDGYTLLFAAGTALNLVPLMTDLPYKFDDLIPIASTSSQIQMLAVSANTPWKTVRDLIEYGKKNPVKIGISGFGTSVHICGEILAHASNIKFAFVPYKSIMEAITAVIGGHIEGVISMPQTVIPQVKGGKLRVITVFSSERFPFLSEAPTIKEAGIPFEMEAGKTWFGIFAPKGTPPPICDKWSEAVRKAINDKEVLSSFEKMATIAEFQNQKEFKASLEKQLAMYQRVIDKMGLKKK
jgi:tripartite-type tricarboxylate transporter receptor subunit TctC